MTSHIAIKLWRLDRGWDWSVRFGEFVCTEGWSETRSGALRAAFREALKGSAAADAEEAERLKRIEQDADARKYIS